MRAPVSSLVVAWTMAVTACTAHRAYVREADIAVMNTRTVEPESLCPAPPRAIGGGPTDAPPTGTISLGTVTAPDDGPRARSAPGVAPRANTMSGSSGNAVPTWWNSPPPVVIEDGPSPTIGPGGSGFTIRPGY